MYSWNRSQNFKWQYCKLGIFCISQSQPALACSSYICLLKVQKKPKSDISAACCRISDIFRKSFPLNILTAPFSYSGHNIIKPAEQKMLTSKSMLVAGSQFAHRCSWRPLCGHFRLLCGEMHPMTLSSTKTSRHLNPTAFSMSYAGSTGSLSLCWGLSEVFIVDIIRAASCVRGVQGGVFEALVATLLGAWAHKCKMC